MWYIYTKEYYSTIKANEILPFATVWVNLEGIMLSEMSRIEKDKYCMTSFIHGIFKKKKLIEKVNRMVVAKAEG